MTSKSMKIKMQFENPESISLETTDSVVLSFKKAEKFLVSAKTRFSTPNGLSAQMKLPAQLPDTLATRSLSGASTFTSKSLSVISVGNVAVNVVAKASLQQLWGTINSLQLIVILPLHNTTYPANTQVLFDALVQVVLFDIAEQGEQIGIQNPLVVADTDPFNDKFDALGFGSANIIENLQSINYILAFIVLNLVVYLLMNIECGESKWNPVKAGRMALI